MDNASKVKSSLKLIANHRDAKISISHYLAIYCWLGWISFYPTLAIAAPLLWKYSKLSFGLVTGIVVTSALYTIDRKKQPKWGFAIGKWIMKSAADYFQFQLYAEDFEALEKASKPAIFALEPHDVLPVSIFGLSDFLGYLPKEVKLLGCLSSACFNVPLMRHVYTWASAVSIDKKNIQRMLSKGISPCLCPGGVQEVIHLSNEKKECVLFLNSRT
eukprot:gene9728-13093_t